jgi:tripartite motif-containing protein 71
MFVKLGGRRGTGNGKFNVPWGIAIDSRTYHVYVVDGGNNRIQEFTENGNFIRAWGTRGNA